MILGIQIRIRAFSKLDPKPCIKNSPCTQSYCTRQDKITHKKVKGLLYIESLELGAFFFSFINHRFKNLISYS